MLEQLVILTLAVARTDAARARGLMDLSAMPPGIDGMIFVFDTPSAGVFWNVRTLMPLDVAFFDEAGRLIEVHPLRSIHESGGAVERAVPSRPYRIAIEVPRGRLQGAAVGAKLETPFGLCAPVVSVGLGWP